jgi:hypothetical protein
MKKPNPFFVFKPFIQGLDGVIHPLNKEKTSVWPKRWDRTCGNPINKKHPVTIKNVSKSKDL